MGPDLYSIASAEITHVLGLISDKNNDGGAWNGYRLESSGFATNTNIVDNAEGLGLYGRYWTFDGLTVDHLMTSYNSGDATNASWGNIVHSAGGGGNIDFNNVNWRGSEDVGNANYGINERTMPSWVMAHVLADAYAYSISDPESFGSMYAGINNSNGVLTIRGGEGNSSDVIRLGSFTFQGTQYIAVSVDVGDDVPGTRHLAGTGNLPEWLSSFPAGSVSNIVINGGAGQDFIRIEDNAGKPVTVNAGDGDDFIDFSFGGRNLSNITAVTTVNGGTGTDSVFLYDNNNAQNDGYLINTLGVIRNGFAGFTIGTGIEATTLITGTGNNQVDIPLARAGMNVFLNSAGGQDVVNIGAAPAGLTGILSDIQVQNDPALTTININGMGNNTPRTALIDQGANNFGYLSGLAPATIYWDNFDVREIHVTTGGDGDTIQVRRSSERMFFSNSGGLDHLSIGNSDTGIDQVTAEVDVGPNAAAAYTDLTIIDTGGTVGRNIRWVPSGSGFSLLGLPIGIRYENVSQLSVLGGSGNDLLTVSNANRTLDNLPLVGFAGGGGIDQIIFDDSGFNGSDLYRIDDTSYYFSNGNVLAGTFQADVESFWLKTGGGNDAVNFAITPNVSTFRNYMVTPGGGINAINIDDTRSSAASLLDVQSAPSFGYVTMAERTADLNFSNVQIVNLYKTPGSIVDLSFYNPADFQLNIFEGATHGDFNGDGRWNVRDLDALVARIATGALEDSYDLNRDGQLNLLDRDFWLAEAGGVNLGFGLVYRLGDANLDGYVDGLDFTIWNSHKFTANSEWSSGNFNADLFVDGVDFTIWNSHKFTSSFGARDNNHFAALPGTDGIPGTPDGIPVGPGDFGSRTRVVSPDGRLPASNSVAAMTPIASITKITAGPSQAAFTPANARPAVTFLDLGSRHMHRSKPSLVPHVDAIDEVFALFV